MRRLLLSLLLLFALCAISWAADPALANRPLTKEQMESMVQDQVDQAMRAQRPKWEDRIEVLSKDYARHTSEGIMKEVEVVLERAKIDNVKLEVKVDESQKNLTWWFSFFSIILIILTAAAGFLSWKYTNKLSRYEKEGRRILLQLGSMQGDAEKIINNIGMLSDEKKLTDKQKETIESVVKDKKIPAIIRIIANGYKAVEGGDWKTAADLFKAASLIDPSSSVHLVNTAIAIQNLAGDTDTVDRERLLNEAISLYKQAESIDGDAVAFNNHGLALRSLIEYTGDVDKKILLMKEAIELFKKAIEIDNKFVAAYVNHAAMLVVLSLTVGNDEVKEELINKAMKIYGEALKIDDKDYKVINSLGVSFMKIAHSTNNENTKNEYYREAENKFHQVEKISPNRAAYNLACLYALQSKEELCRQWLIKAQDWIKKNCFHFLTDSDFDGMRDKEWFQKVIAEICPEGRSSVGDNKPKAQ